MVINGQLIFFLINWQVLKDINWQLRFFFIILQVARNMMKLCEGSFFQPRKSCSAAAAAAARYKYIYHDLFSTILQYITFGTNIFDTNIFAALGIEIFATFYFVHIFAS